MLVSAGFASIVAPRNLASKVDAIVNVGLYKKAIAYFIYRLDYRLETGSVESKCLHIVI